MSEFQIFDVETEVEHTRSCDENTPCDEYDVTVHFTTKPDGPSHCVIVGVEVCRGAVTGTNVLTETHDMAQWRPIGRVTTFQWPLVAAAASKGALEVFNFETTMAQNKLIV